MTRRRVLLVSYHFPPVGGAGVQRPAKFARYLPGFGWDATVLQAANPSVPVLDPSLLADLPSDLVIIKARTLEPGYASKSLAAGKPTNARGGLKSAARRLVRSGAAMVLQPDPQILWFPAARRAGIRALRRVQHDAILATAPSYSNLVLGASLARASGLPLVVDYRDEWDLSSAYWENAPRDPISWRVQGVMQRRVLRQAAALIATTKASTTRLAERAAEAGAAPMAECIYNGWDPADLDTTGAEAAIPPQLPDTFRLVYAGTLWNLTSVAPLVAAVQRLAASHPHLLQRLELVFLGRKTPDQLQLLGQLAATPATVRELAYAEHQAAIRAMQDADALLLLLSDVPGAERVAPAKLFEYLAVDRPMLAVVPEGETAAIVRSVDPDAWHAPVDVAGIAAWLVARLEGRQLAVAAGRNAIRDGFRRREQSGQLAALLDRVVGPRP